MFDSVEGGYVPICFITAFAAWFLSKLGRITVRALLALLIPIALSFAWYFIPDLFRAHPERQDPAFVAWGFVAATAWSAAAVPVSIIVVVISSFIRKRSAYGNRCQDIGNTDKNP